MKRRHHYFIPWAGAHVAALFALAAFLASCADGHPLTPEPPTEAVRQDPARADRFQPLTGRCETAFQITDTRFMDIGSIDIGRSHLVPARITLNITGECRLAQLGRSTVSSVQIINLITGAITAGNVVYITASGDELRAEHTGVITSTDAEGNVTLTGVQTFTGGTGRFENARGAVDFVGRTTAPDAIGRGIGFYSLDGRIKYDASGRSNH